MNRLHLPFFYRFTVLSDLGDELHRARDVWRIGKTCPCKSVGGDEGNSESGAKITELSNEMTAQNGSNGVPASGEELSKSSVTTEISSTASSNQTGGAVDSESSFDDDVNLICDEKLGVESPADHEQEWLTEEKRRNHFTKKAGFGLVEAKPHRDKKVSSGLSLLMDYNSSAEASPCDSPVKDVKSATGMFNFSSGGGGLCGLDLLVLACERNGEYFNSISLNNEGKKEAEKAAPQSKQGTKEIRNGKSKFVKLSWLDLQLFFFSSWASLMSMKMMMISQVLPQNTAPSRERDLLHLLLTSGVRSVLKDRVLALSRQHVALAHHTWPEIDASFLIAQGCVVRKLVNAKPGLEVNRNITGFFFCKNAFHCLCGLF